MVLSLGKKKPWSPNLRTQSRGGNINENLMKGSILCHVRATFWEEVVIVSAKWLVLCIHRFVPPFFLFTFFFRKVEQPVFIQMFKYLSNRLQNWSKMNHPVRDSYWAFTLVRNKTRNSIARLEKVERSDFLMKRFPNATSQFYVKLAYRKSSAQCPHVFVSSKTNLANRPQLVFFINFRVRVRAVCNCF